MFVPENKYYTNNYANIQYEVFLCCHSDIILFKVLCPEVEYECTKVIDYNS